MGSYYSPSDLADLFRFGDLSDDGASPDQINAQIAALQAQQAGLETAAPGAGATLQPQIDYLSQVSALQAQQASLEAAAPGAGAGLQYQIDAMLGKTGGITTSADTPSSPSAPSAPAFARPAAAPAVKPASPASSDNAALFNLFGNLAKVGAQVGVGVFQATQTPSAPRPASYAPAPGAFAAPSGVGVPVGVPAGSLQPPSLIPGSLLPSSATTTNLLLILGGVLAVGGLGYLLLKRRPKRRYEVEEEEDDDDEGDED